MSRRAYRSPSFVTIPLIGSLTASNGAEPSVNTGCTTTVDGLYIPYGSCVEYKLSDLYPKDFTKLVLEFEMKYTKTLYEHGWFDFFDLIHEWYKYIGVNKNANPRDSLRVFDIQTKLSVPFNYIRVIVTVDFSQGDIVYPHGEIENVDTVTVSPYAISKPSAIRLGHHYPDHPAGGWEGYVRNVKVTFK